MLSGSSSNPEGNRNHKLRRERNEEGRDKILEENNSSPSSYVFVSTSSTGCVSAPLLTGEWWLLFVLHVTCKLQEVQVPFLLTPVPGAPELSTGCSAQHPLSCSCSCTWATSSNSLLAWPCSTCTAPTISAEITRAAVRDESQQGERGHEAGDCNQKKNPTNQIKPML